jgi:transposase-like protein
MVLECEEPPQTVQQAMADGWQALVVECPPCKREKCPHFGRLIFRDMDEWYRRSRLVDIFARTKCSRCGQRPRTAKLATSANSPGLDSWHEKPILIVDGYVVRPGRW